MDLDRHAQRVRQTVLVNSTRQRLVQAAAGLAAIRAVVHVFLRPPSMGGCVQPNNSFNCAASSVGGWQAVPVQT